MTGFNFKNRGKIFISLAAVAFISSLFISGCGQAPQDQTQSSLIDKQNSITTTDHNRRLFFKSSHEDIKFGYAVQSCFVKLGSNFLVDGYNSFCGEYNQNQNISTGSVAYVNDIKINGGNVRITGQVVQVQTCEVDISQIIDKARQNNNNSVIPPQFIRDGKLKLENNDRLTLPSGVYYFKEIKVSGRAILEFSGPSKVVVEGNVSVEGQGQIKTNPVFLRIISTERVKVEGQGAIYAGIVGDEIKIDGKGQIFGGVISREFKGEGQGAVHFDEGLGLDKIEVFPSEVTIKVGETVQLTAVAKDIFGNEISCVGFEWSSSDQSVAVVDQNGLVQGVNEGRAIISATAKKEGYNLAFKGEAIVNVITFGLCPDMLKIYTNPLEFKDATFGFSDPVIIDFEDIDGGPVNNTYLGRPEFDGNFYLNKGVMFYNPNGYPLYIAPGGLFWNLNNSLSVWRFPFDDNTTPLGWIDDDDLTIVFDPPCIAVGFTIVDNNTFFPTEVIQFVDYHGSIITEVNFPPNYTYYRAFIGIVSPVPIARINVLEEANDWDDINYDDFICFTKCK